MQQLQNVVEIHLSFARYDAIQTPVRLGSYPAKTSAVMPQQEVENFTDNLEVSDQKRAVAVARESTVRAPETSPASPPPEAFQEA
jgi:hypothetical protein